MITEKITKAVKEAVEACGFEVAEIQLEHPADLSHGDYSTNVAMSLAAKSGAKPKEVAEKLVKAICEAELTEIEKVEVAGPGFINFYISRAYFASTVEKIISTCDEFGKGVSMKGKKVMVEYTDPNPFKEFHIGHLMSNTIGESLSRLIEFSGAEVKRACYQGDVGLHVAKAIWGMKQSSPREDSPLQKLPLAGKARFLGQSYSIGAKACEEGHKEEIEEINQKIYDRSDSEINKLYDWGRKISLEYFEQIYERLGTKFDYYFFESEMAVPGLKVVREFLAKGIFEESEGAVVFKGEKYNPKLHTRVFISSKGLPTYEAKELALHKAKAGKYHADLSVVVTANEQNTVFGVGLEAFRQIDSEAALNIKHISHGMLRLPSGKMSSRTGDVITAEKLIGDIDVLVADKIKSRDYVDELKDEIIEKVGIGALKFSILKQNIGGDIIFDFDKSISFEGDSGPYLQYAVTRAKSVLAKAKEEGIKESVEMAPSDVTLVERLLIKFPEVAERAAKEFAPHRVVQYLLELASAFNSYYANEQIVAKGDKYSPYKISMTRALVETIERGLWLLGIATPTKM